jgi:hypothetical protein
MNRRPGRPHGSGTGFVLLTLLLGPGAALAQTPLPASEAQAFLGNWNVALQTDMGPVDFGIHIRDVDGNVIADASSPQGTETVSDISREEASLVLRYSLNADGQVFPVSITLLPDGDVLRASLNVGGGMFTATGTGTRIE